MAKGTALVPGQHLLDQGQLSENLFSRKENVEILRWNDEGLCLPDAYAPLLNLRGTDAPSLPRIPKAQMSKKQLKQPKPSEQVVVLTSRATSILVVTANKDRSNKTFGAPKAPMKDGSVKFKVDMSSQLPSLSVDYEKLMDDGYVRIHRVVFHGNTGLRGVAYHDTHAPKLERTSHSRSRKTTSLPPPGRAVAISLTLGQTGPAQRHENCVTVLHDNHSGIEKDLFKDRWKSHGDMRDTIDKDTAGVVSKFDAAVRSFFYKKNIPVTFIRGLAEGTDDDGRDAFDQHYRYWLNLMQIAIKHGSLWFYKMQPNYITVLAASNTSQWSKASAPVPILFLLVKKFQVTVTEHGITRLTPMVCDLEQFPCLPNRAVPGARKKAVVDALVKAGEARLVDEAGGFGDGSIRVMAAEEVRGEIVVVLRIRRSGADGFVR